MGKGLDNYYLVLELDFLTPEADCAVIEKRIKEKADFWRKNSERGQKAQKYRTYIKEIPMMKKTMDNDALRINEAKEAERFVRGKLEEGLRREAGAEEIDPKVANALMSNCGFSDVAIFERMTGLKVKEKKKEEKRNPLPKPENTAKFKTYDKNLNVLQKKNLYDFLAGDSKASVTAMQAKDNESLLALSAQLKVNVKPRSEEATVVHNLCAACEDVFKKNDVSLRKQYDQYLEWIELKAIAEAIVLHASDNRLREAQEKAFMDDIIQVMRDPKAAEKIFAEICDYYDIWIHGRSLSDTQVMCGVCHHIVETSHGERKCTNCGHDLYIKCPGCQNEILLSSKSCGHCGFVLENIQKAETLCIAIEQAISNMDLFRARADLESAKRLKVYQEKLNVLEKKLKPIEDSFLIKIQEMDKLVKKRAFYQAHSILNEVRRKAPNAQIPNAILIESAVKNAENLYKTALKETSEKALIKKCSEINAICSDYPGVDGILGKFPPEAVKKLDIVCDEKNGINKLSWSPCVSEGDISYKIVRKAKSAPASHEDGEEVGQCGLPNFSDNSIKGGEMYYYAVYAVRAGIYSKPAYQSAINCTEICGVSGSEGDGVITITRKALRGLGQVRITRCEGRIPKHPKDGTLIPVSGGNMVLDYSVENEKKYGYLVFITYVTAQGERTTEGVGIELVPAALPQAVEDLEITSLSDGMFEATWSGDGRIELYFTEGRTNLSYGDVITLQDLTKKLVRLETVSRSRNRCQFRLTEGKKYIVFPVTIKNNTAVIGQQALAAWVESLKIKSIEEITGDILIFMDWPKDAENVLVIFGHNGYAKNIEDRRGKTAVTFKKAVYDVSNALRIKQAEKKDYFFSIYVGQKVNGKITYSEGTQVLFYNKPKSDIEYCIQTRGHLKKKVEVIFRSPSQDRFLLPEIIIVAKQNGIPLYARTGTVVKQIGEQMVEGSYSVDINTGNLPKGSFVKVFFANENVNDEISLRPAYGTNFKVC